MIEEIKLALINESGDAIPIEKMSGERVAVRIDIAIADLFSQICFRNNAITDAEIHNAEKFLFALNLKNYLEEMNNAD